MVYFTRESLPLKIRHYLLFNVCIVTELVCVLYRNPIHKVDSLEFENLVHNFKELHQKIILFTGDFNAHSLNWWSQGDSTKEGIQLDNLFSDLNLTQIVTEPTHFHENCRPSCIDLTQLVLNSGVRPPLDTCKH